MKRCTKCTAEKKKSEFSKNRCTVDGLQLWCKDCGLECSRVYNQTHKTEISEQRRGHYQKNRTELLEKQKEYSRSHQAERKEYNQTPIRKESNRKSDKKYREKYPERAKAHHAVNSAIKAGELHRPSVCEDCNEKKFVEGHHPDYDKLLEVDWLCKECHTELHRVLQEQS